MSFEKPPIGSFEGLNLEELGIDESYLRFVGLQDDENVYSLSENCDKCPFQLRTDFVENSTTLKLSTHFPWSFRLAKSGSPEQILSVDDNSGLICTLKNIRLQEFGVYDFSRDCELTESFAPADNPNLALLICFLVLAVAGGIYKILYNLGQRGKFQSATDPIYKFLKKQGFNPTWRWITPSSNDESQNKKSPSVKQRLKSLDTFRGISIALMTFVNDGAGGYYFMEHTTWNGLYVADLAFPWFIWIMGFCIPMSVRSTLKKKTPLTVTLFRIFKRSVKLFLLGFFSGNNGWINLEKVRIFGVLQRFGVCYFVVASTCAIVAKLMNKDEEEKSNKIEMKSENQTSHDVNKNIESGISKEGDNRVTSRTEEIFEDILELWPRWLVAFSCLFIHQLVTLVLEVPGCGKGYLGPGGLHNDAVYLEENCIGGAMGYIDRLILGSNHIYQNPTAKFVYQSGPFDPEGPFGCLITIFQVFLGYQGGQIILTYKKHSDRLARFLAWAVTTGLLGLILCSASLNDGWIPINKNLWSLSYVLVTTACANFLMAVCYFFIDVKHWWGGEPFFFAGMNSIVLYLGHGIAWQMLPFNFISGPMRTHMERLPESLWGVSLWMFVAYIMYRRKVFIVV